MSQALITKEIAIKAVLSGSCFVPIPGQPISELTTSNLIWAETVGFTPADIGAQMPLWTLSGDGNGNGNGYGDGYGNGNGYGYGDGDGYGNGNGYGNGYGDGNGDGNGYGDGYGYGDGKDLGSVVNKILRTS